MTDLKSRRGHLDQQFSEALGDLEAGDSPVDTPGMLAPYERELAASAAEAATLDADLNLARLRLELHLRQIGGLRARIEVAGLQEMEETAMELFEKRDLVDEEIEGLERFILSTEASIQELAIHRMSVTFRRDHVRRKLVELEASRDPARSLSNSAPSPDRSTRRARRASYRAEYDELRRRLQGSGRA